MPDTAMDANAISNIPLFSTLNGQERQSLAALFKPQTYKPGEHIVWVGEAGQEFMVIRAGRVMICLPDEAGKELCLATLGPGNFFGEISLLDGGPRTATARAETEVEILRLGREDFFAFLHRNPSVAVHMLTILGQRQRETNEKLRGIKNVNEVIKERSTLGQIVAERIASAFATNSWLVVNVVFFTIWIVVNSVLYRTGRHIDEPPTFFTLGFIITLEAILLSMFVLNSQKRQTERDRIRAEIEYQVNLKNHLTVMQLHQKVDHLEQAILQQQAGKPGPTPMRPTLPDAAA